MKTEKSYLTCPNCDIYQEVQKILDIKGNVTYLTFSTCKHTIFRQNMIDRCLNNGHIPEIIKEERK